MANSAADKPYLTPNEAAALLMVAPATLRVWTDKGLLKAHTTAGGHRRFTRQEIERYLRARDGAATRRVLIVDDEAPILRYLQALLDGKEGTITATAPDGFSAGHLVHAFRPDFILLDLMMPGLDGFQVCRRIKSDPATRAIRIIAMTGFASPENNEGIIAAGAECCLSKPLDEDLLLSVLGITPSET